MGAAPRPIGPIAPNLLAASYDYSWRCIRYYTADRFALDLTHDGEAAKTVIVKYAQVALYVPDPGWFRKNFRMDHPSLDDRARFLDTYHPWIRKS